MGAAVTLHPAAGDRRVHQRHRRADRQHADPRFLRPAARARYRASSGRGSSPSLSHANSFSPTTTAVASVALASILVWNRFVRRIPGYIVVLLAGTVLVAVLRSAGRDDRQPIRRHSAGVAAAGHPAVPRRSDPDAGRAGSDRCPARRDRVADVGGRRRSDGRRPAQPERRADRAGHRQRGVAAVRRPAGDRSDRADGDEHPLGRADAGRRDDPRADAAHRPAGRRAAGALRPARRARRRS